MKTNVTTILLALFLLAGATTLPAAAADVSRLPGYVDLGAIEMPAGAELEQEIDLGPELLAAAFRSPEATTDEARLMGQALEMVKSVRLVSFRTDLAGSARVREQVDALQKKLEGRSWKRVVMVRDQEEYVVVSALHGPDHIQGLLVMAVEADEATFVNVVGELNFATLAQLATQIQSAEMQEVLEGLQQEGAAEH